MWQDSLALIAEKKKKTREAQLSKASVEFLTELKTRKLTEVNQLEHEINVIMLSNKEAGEQIQTCQKKISEAS